MRSVQKVWEPNLSLLWRKRNKFLSLEKYCLKYTCNNPLTWSVSERTAIKNTVTKVYIIYFYYGIFFYSMAILVNNAFKTFHPP